jgi:hypothetical protein
LGILDQLTEATVTKGDLVIPTHKLIQLADQPYFDELLKDVRLAQGDPSAREAEANQADYENYVKELSADIEKKNSANEEFNKSADMVYESIRSDLEATKKFTPDVIDRYALLHRAFAVTIADRTGQTPVDVYTKYGLQVRDASLSPEQIALAKNIRSGKLASDKAVHGKSLLQFLADRGGLMDDGGELTARDADKWNRGKPGQKRLVTEGGASLDAALEAAIEAGYIQGEQGITNVNDLLTAMDSELRGNPVFSDKNTNQTAFKDREGIQAMRARLEEMGIDVNASSDRDIIEAIYGRIGIPGEIVNEPGIKPQEEGLKVNPDDITNPAMFEFQAFQDDKAYGLDINDIPEKLKVEITKKINGKDVKKKVSAKKTIMAYDQRINALDLLRGCLNG